MDKPLQPFTDGLPNLSEAHFATPTLAHLEVAQPFTHAPRFLILYGSLRERSFSRFLAYEAARLLEAMGGEVRIYDAHGLPLPDDTTADHLKVQELRDLSIWSEGHVWVSPERHGNLSGRTRSMPSSRPTISPPRNTCHREMHKR